MSDRHAKSPEHPWPAPPVWPTLMAWACLLGAVAGVTLLPKLLSDDSGLAMLWSLQLIPLAAVYEYAVPWVLLAPSRAARRKQMVWLLLPLPFALVVLLRCGSYAGLMAGLTLTALVGWWRLGVHGVARATADQPSRAARIGWSALLLAGGALPVLAVVYGLLALSRDSWPMLGYWLRWSLYRHVYNEWERCVIIFAEAPAVALLVLVVGCLALRWPRRRLWRRLHAQFALGPDHTPRETD